MRFKLNKKLAVLFISTLISGCSTAKWPSQNYMIKNNYEEIIGQIDSAGQSNIPDKFAMYPNGLKGVNDFIVKAFKYPVGASGTKGKVIIKYIVEKDGWIKEAFVVQSVHPILDNESIRVIKSMRRWVPGIQDGKFVRVEYTQPFTF